MWFLDVIAILKSSDTRVLCRSGTIFLFNRPNKEQSLKQLSNRLRSAMQDTVSGLSKENLSQSFRRAKQVYILLTLYKPEKQVEFPLEQRSQNLNTFLFDHS